MKKIVSVIIPAFMRVMRKNVLEKAKRVAILLILAAVAAGCDKDHKVILNEDPPEIGEPNNEAPLIFDIGYGYDESGCLCIDGYDEMEVMEFCSYINLENIGKTIPLVNQYLGSLPKDLDDERKTQLLAAWFQSHPCIIDSRIILHEISGYPPMRNIAFSFRDGEIIRELILDFSTTGRALSYHYDLIKGVYVKTTFTEINKVFDFINSHEFNVKEIQYGTYVSSMPSDSANLKLITNNLKAKPYTNDSWVIGHLNWYKPGITFFVQLYEMHNKDYQADWLKSMNDYQLVERMDEQFGYVIVFDIPENPENKGAPNFDEYEFVDWADFSYNRYTIYDQSIGNGNNTGANSNIDSKINIRMVETFYKSPRTFQLVCSTTKIYPCPHLMYAVCRQSSNDIDISFKGVMETRFGFTVESPSTTVINLGELNDGTYNLNLYNGDVKHTGKLVVSSDSYEVSFDDNTAFSFTNTPLNRIPEHTIWGTIGYHRQETSKLAQSFINELTDLGAEKKPYQPGLYGQFGIDQNGDIVQTGRESGYWFAQNFIFRYSGDIENVERLVRKYARNYGTDISISVYSDKGKRLLSWMY